MNKPMGDIAMISSGVTLRSHTHAYRVADGSDSVRVVSMRDLTGDSLVDVRKAHQMRVSYNAETQQLRRDDLVFSSRGWLMRAALMEEDADDVVVAAPLMRVRVE